MRYVFLILSVLAIGVFAGTLYAQEDEPEYWQPPTTCDDEDRVVPGNRGTPCKYVFPKLERVEYRVRMEYPYCQEELVFNVPGLKPVPSGSRWEVQAWHGPYLPGAYISSHNIYEKGNQFHGMRGFQNAHIRNDEVALTGGKWSLESEIVTESAYFRPAPRDYPDIQLYLWLVPPGAIASPGNVPGYDVISNYVRFPDISSIGEKVNICLSRVRTEQTSREHAAALARAEAEEAARISAEATAVAKEREAIQKEGESQARIAAQQIAAAKARKLEIAQIELHRTQNLVAQITHEEALAVVLREIVRIRLAGKEDRARITNEYLNRAAALDKAFEEETATVEARIQQYLDFNDALLEEIAGYHTSVRSRLENLEIQLAEQWAEIDELNREAEKAAENEVSTEDERE